MKRLFILALLLFPIQARAALDIYGGDGSHPCVGTMPLGGAIPGATGYFYLYKDTNLTHWMWCDPLGNRMWMTGAEVVDTGGQNYVSIVQSKYGALGTSTSWEATQTKRLQALGFNTVGEFGKTNMWAPSGNQPNPIPFILQIQPALYDVTVKDIFANLPPKWDSFGGYRGYRSIDLYDPLWQALGTGVGGNLWNCTSAWGISCATLDASPYLLSTAMDDVSRVGMIYTNQSVYAVAITAPYEQFENSYGIGRKAVFSTTPTMYTKSQWGTWLCGTQYANLAALNTAWGSSYDSCGSDAATSGTETIGTGNGSTTSFSATLAHTVVDPASIGIKVGGVLQAGDTPWFNANVCTRPTNIGCIQAASGNIGGSYVTTAASVTSNVATLTFAINPSTAGLAANIYVTVTGFSGADNYFNGTFTIISVTSTTITYALNHANGSASTSGNVTASTVGYVDGKIGVTFSVAPANGVAITATYQYNGWPRAMTQTYALTQSASDTFVRANGTLGANWTTTPGLTALQIVSNTVEGTSASAGARNGDFYNAISPPNDQYSTITVGTITTANDAVGATVRQSGSSETQDLCFTYGPTGGTATAYLQEFNGGVFKFNSNPISITLNVGDTITCAVVGTKLIMEQNGKVIGTATSGLTSGKVGAFISMYPNSDNVANATITGWNGGSASVTAGLGNGLLDEDGSSPWWPTGDPESRSAFPDPPVGTIPTDMDVFLNLVVGQYFTPVRTWLKNNLPHHMNSSVNPGGLGNRTQVYSSEAANADVLLYANAQSGINSDFTNSAVPAYNSIPVPVYVGEYMAANPDSQFSSSACPFQSALCFATQDAKGAFYQSQASFDYTGVTGGDSYEFIVGLDYWEWVDNASESGAYGVVSLRDNLYNAANCPASTWPKEDVNSSITDHFGFTTTAEAATYGNFICSGVVSGNAVWLSGQPIVVSITGQPPSSLQVNAVTGITASVANDGGAAGVDWTLTCGGGSCGTITAHTASGVAATYTAPAAVPPGAVVAKATSTTDNTKSASANGITITTAANIVCCNIKKGSLPFLGGNGTGPLFRVPHVGLPR